MIQKQTGNGITDLREQLGAEVTNPAFDLDIHDAPFDEALDRIARLAEVSVNAFTGDGTIGITAGTPSKDPLIRYVGPFRVAFKQFTEVRLTSRQEPRRPARSSKSHGNPGFVPCC